MAGDLFCPIYQIFPDWFHCTMFRRICCFRLTTVLENCHSDTLHNISRHKLATVFWYSMCEISFMTRFKQQRCRCLLSGGSLGHWTACNNFKRHCTLPYCGCSLWRKICQSGDLSVSVSYQRWKSSIMCKRIKRHHYIETSSEQYLLTWWRHQMETFSALLAICSGNSPVPGEFPSQRPVTRSFNVFFDLRQ